jgi:hypothetical protein
MGQGSFDPHPDQLAGEHRSRTGETGVAEEMHDLVA